MIFLSFPALRYSTFPLRHFFLSKWDAALTPRRKDFLYIRWLCAHELKLG